MMDISDGLSSEIFISVSKATGCRYCMKKKFLIHEDARMYAFKLELDPTACALSGGEDYELIFTIKQEDYDKLVLMKTSVLLDILQSLKRKLIFTKGGNTHEVIAQGWKHQ